MSEVAIQVEALSKLYYIGAEKRRAPTLGGRILQSVRNASRRIFVPKVARSGSSEVEELWALKNVSFSAKRGDVIGLMGLNGSGKSTLLKIMSQITAPTSGQAILQGRVGSLLEVGTGFHPDLTGRENIYLAGAVLGMKKEQVDCFFDQIVAFAGVGRFIDTPLKRYSSGMYLRLAFAVASHLDPDILILDEVLAVGDASFQKRSLEKVEDVSSSGKTVIFVSHNLESVARLCNRGLVLSNGQLVFDGDVTEALTYYRKSLFRYTGPESEEEKEARLPARRNLEQAKRFDASAYRIIKWVSTHKKDNTPTAYFRTGDTVRIRVGLELEFELHAYFQINFLRYDAMRVMVLHDSHAGKPIILPKGYSELEVIIEDLRLLAGNYSIVLDMGRKEPAMEMDTIPKAHTINVELDDYLPGWKLVQGQVVFAQQSTWNLTQPEATQ